MKHTSVSPQVGGAIPRVRRVGGDTALAGPVFSEHTFTELLLLLLQLLLCASILLGQDTNTPKPLPYLKLL